MTMKRKVKKHRIVVELDGATKKDLQRKAKNKGTSVSYIVRQAIHKSAMEEIV